MSFKQNSGPGFATRIAARFSSLWTVAGLLLLSEFVYIALVRFEAVSTARSVLAFIALMTVLFAFYGTAYLSLKHFGERQRGAFTLIIVGAILFRITLLFAGIPRRHTLAELAPAVRADVRGQFVTYDSFLLFDNDVWRYAWDGHVAAAGVNPYLYEPRNPALDRLVQCGDNCTLWGDIRANVNHPEIPTIYPPFAQVIFRFAHAIAPGSVFIMKSLFVLCDLVTVLFVALTLRILNRPLADTILYAWNPLVIKVVAGSGHVDAVLAMLLSATVYFMLRGSHFVAASTWALSVLVKLSPVVLLPFLIRCLGWRRSAVGVTLVAIGYLPYLDHRGSAFVGLRTFADNWQFNSASFSTIEWLAGYFTHNPILIAKATAALAFLVMLAWLIHKDDAQSDSFAFYAVTALGACLLLSPALMPWYIVWLIPLAVVGRVYVWIQFSLAVCLAFIAMIHGAVPAWALAIEYGTFCLYACRAPLRRTLFKYKFCELQAARPTGRFPDRANLWR